MGSSLKMFSCNNLRGLLILINLTLFANLIKAFMALSKPLEFGSLNSSLGFSTLAFLLQKLTPSSSLFIKKIVQFLSLSMLMIWSSLCLHVLLWIIWLSLVKVFSISDLERLTYFLGLKLDYIPNGLLISQRKYISNLLTKINMLAANTVSSLMSNSLKLLIFDFLSFDNVTLFQSTVWSLQYLFLTRPDMSFAINKVC